MTAATIPLHGAPRLAERTCRGLDIISRAPRSSPLVAGLCGTGSLVVIGGPPGSTKSFVAQHIAMSVATGQPFLGRGVLTGPVIYIIAEGAGGIGPRVDAWADANGKDIDAVTWLLGAVALADRAQVADLTELVAYIAPALVVIDTFGRCTPGVDENSARDMGAVIAALDALRDASGAAILLVHHVGKDLAKGLRGSTALTAAADTILLTQRTRSGGLLTTTKAKDGIDGQVGRYTLEPRRDSAILVAAGEGEGTPAAFRPTWLMGALSRIIEEEPGLSGRVLVNERLEGKSRDGKRLALQLLVSEGFVRTEPGPRSATLHFLIQPFTEHADD